MDVDPLASMCCWPAEVDIGGQTYQIPALPAARWWPALAEADLFRVLELIPDGAEIEDRLFSGSLTSDDLAQSLTDVIEEMTGRPLMPSMLLAGAAAGHWPVIGGSLARSGFRWDVMPIGAALDAIYSVITENMDEKKLAEFNTLLSRPAPGPDGKRRIDRRKAVADMEQFAGPMPTIGVLIATGEQSGDTLPRTQQRSQPRRLPDPFAAPRRRPGRHAGNGRPARNAAL